MPKDFRTFAAETSEPLTMRLERVTADYGWMGRLDAIAREAFPPEEYLSPKELTEMAGRMPLDFWALYDGESLVGFMAVVAEGGLAYLFLLAIDAQCRSRGYGGEALRLFEATYPRCGHVLDIEKVGDEAPNAGQRRIRRRFYLRNGYRPTGHFLSYLDEEFEILSLEEGFDIASFKALLGRLSIDGFQPRYYSLPDR